MKYKIYYKLKDNAKTKSSFLRFSSLSQYQKELKIRKCIITEDLKDIDEARDYWTEFDDNNNRDLLGIEEFGVADGE